MTVIIIIFMVLVALMCIFTGTITTIDMVRERKKSKEEEPAAEEPAADATVAVVAVPAPAADADDTVSFSTIPKQTHHDKYLALSSEQRRWYDEIVEYTRKLEDLRFVQTDRYEEFRYYGKRTVRFTIKRGTEICEFLVPSDFSKFVSENKMPIKQQATAMKIENVESVSSAKDCIQFAYNSLVEERAENKRQEKERRKAARLQAKANKTEE